MAANSKRMQFLTDLLMVVAPTVLTFFVIRQFASRMDADRTGEDNKKRQVATRRIENILADRAAQQDSDSDADTDSDIDSEESRSRNGRKRTFERPRIQDFSLSTYEQSIATEVVHPSEIPVTFADIGGLDAIISDLQESVIYPLTLPHLYASNSSLLSAPAGVLLHGPPGCGKTMLAKALAHESGACFINLHISTLTEKWYGDSNKLVAAVFSLARKLAPAIVFIDEIDALLGTRRTGDHEASSMVKAEFMTHWDGLASAETGSRTPQRIVILGATNRLQDIDEAILRRMPKRFAIGLPDVEQRRRIFKLVLRGMKMDEQVDENGLQRHFDWDYVVRASAGMSGSEIKEACREAAMMPMRQFIKQKKAKGESMKKVKPEDIRGLRTEDFFRDYRYIEASGLRELDDDGFETTSESSKDSRPMNGS